MRQLSRAAQKRTAAHARPRTKRRASSRQRLWADIVELLRRDVANVKAGLYPLPDDHDGPLPTLLDRSRLFFQDLAEVHRRRERGIHDESLGTELAGKRPRYWLQNFHFQSGGWLTEASARRYDIQVEVLFRGTANAMRRQVLPELQEKLAGRDQRRLRLLDIGCGTGRFLDAVKQVWPQMLAIGLDLSDAYVREARRHLARRPGAAFVIANAEAIPLPDDSQDAVTGVFLFHELPPEVRRVVFAEVSRVLKPGGRFVIADSVQLGDVPEYDGMLERFPHNLHEPYFASYAIEPFHRIARDCGLDHVRDRIAFLSKIMVFDKPRRS